jgi:hypothetical protein
MGNDAHKAAPRGVRGSEVGVARIWASVCIRGNPSQDPFSTLFDPLEPLHGLFPGRNMPLCDLISHGIY